MKRLFALLGITGLPFSAAAQQPYVGPNPPPYINLLPSDFVYVYRLQVGQLLPQAVGYQTLQAAVAASGATTAGVVTTPSSQTVGTVAYFTNGTVVQGDTGMTYSAGTLTLGSALVTPSVIASGGQITNPFFLGAVTLLGGGQGQASYFVYTAATVANIGTIEVDVTSEWNTLILSGSSTGHPNEVITFTNTPANAVQEFRLLIKNTDSVLHTPTFPSSWSFNAGASETSVKIQPSSYVLLTWRYDGATYYLQGDPRTVSDLSTNSTPLPTDLVAVETVATPGIVNKEATSALHIKSFTFSVNGNGTVLTTGLQSAFVKVPYAGTLIGYDMVVSPSGSVTVDVDGAPSGSLPTTGNSIVGSGTKPATSSAVDTSSTTLTSWTTPVTAGENFGINITAATTSTSLTITFYYQ